MTRAEIEQAIASLEWPIQARDEDFVEVPANVVNVALACLRDYVRLDDPARCPYGNVTTCCRHHAACVAIAGSPQKLEQP